MRRSQLIWSLAILCGIALGPITQVKADYTISITSPGASPYPRGSVFDIAGLWSDGFLNTDPSYVQIFLYDANEQIRLQTYVTPVDTDWGPIGDSGDWSYSSYTVPAQGKAGDWALDAMLQDSSHNGLVSASMDVWVTNAP